MPDTPERRPPAPDTEQKSAAEWVLAGAAAADAAAHIYGALRPQSGQAPPPPPPTEQGQPEPPSVILPPGVDGD